MPRAQANGLPGDIPLAITDDDTALLSQARDTIAKRLKGQTAPQRILDCLEAAGTMAFDEGLAAERRAFEACMEDPQSTALRHLFFAERTASKIDGMAVGTEAQPVKHVGIIGAGTMGGGIAMCFAQSGFRVTLVDQDQEGLERGLGIIKKNYEISVKRGRLSAEQVEGFLRNLEPTTDWQQLQNVDLVIEAVFENLELKQSVFQKLDKICAVDTILASNTSYQSIDALAAATNRPDRVVGMHFLAPLMSCGYWRWFEAQPVATPHWRRRWQSVKKSVKSARCQACATGLSAIVCCATTAVRPPFA